MLLKDSSVSIDLTVEKEGSSGALKQKLVLIITNDEKESSKIEFVGFATKAARFAIENNYELTLANLYNDYQLLKQILEKSRVMFDKQSDTSVTDAARNSG